MLEKTFSTFHTSNVLLQQQYRKKAFTTYANLISCLLLAEQNNELLMRNSELRPPGSTPLPEAHVAAEASKETNHVQNNSQRGRGRGRWQGRGRGHNNFFGRGQGNSFGRGQGNHYGRDRDYQSNFGRGISFKPQNPHKSMCHRCGMSNHWAKTCRTPKHLVDLYQESLKGKNPEAHLIYQDGEDDFHDERDDLMVHHERDDLMEYETSD